MVKIHACLIGKWVCLNDDPECKFVDTDQSPDVWWEENAPIYKNVHKPSDSYYQQDYVNIRYEGKVYRIHPMFIQIVHE